ncbi:MAG: hypothetical protein KDC57_24050, partial [Saprospiraceae bacterium]|nr:hypothetical protein [Saprospiraceae bacterium]
MRVTLIANPIRMWRVIGLLTTVLTGLTGHAQIINGQDTLLGNEWIVPGQPYFMFKISEDGVYRIYRDDLLAAGIPVTSISVDNYQLMHNGSEVPLRVTGDFLEFIGQQNRGEIDRYLYAGGEQDQLNPYYSLYTDTSAYYLTWSEGVHRRYTLTRASAGEPATWFWQDVRLSFHTTHVKPYELNNTSVKFAHYVPGEGYGASLRVTSSYTVETPDLYTGGPDPVLDAGFVTRDEDHRILVQWNGMPLDTLHFNGLESRRLHYLLPSAKARNNIRIQGLAGNLDRHYLGFVNVRYPRAFTRLPEGWIRLDSFSNAQSVAVDSLQSRWAAWN